MRSSARSPPARERSTQRRYGVTHDRPEARNRGAMMEAAGKAGELREAGELLGVEAIDRTGLVVTSEGAFVRILRVAPVNPLLMSGEEREKTAGSFQRLISQLHADERIEVVVEGRPVNLEELLAKTRHEVEASAGPPPT